MKTWFMGPTREASDLRDKYGPYPGLWKEVLNWPGWKEARKAYLRFTEGGADTTQSKPTTDDSQIPRKRASRWGNAAEDQPQQSQATFSDGDIGPPPAQRQRRSRWGQDQSGGGGSDPNIGTVPHHPPPTLAPPTAPPAPIMALPGLGLPGMPMNLTPQQQDDFRGYQTRLKEVNNTLENLDAEAARVDALPRGHRDRSPSPPPGRFFRWTHCFIVAIDFPVDLPWKVLTILLSCGSAFDAINDYSLRC